MEEGLAVKSRKPIFRPSHMIDCKRKHTICRGTSVLKIQSCSSRERRRKIGRSLDMGSFQNGRWLVPETVKGFGGARTSVSLYQISGPVKCHTEVRLGMICNF